MKIITLRVDDELYDQIHNISNQTSTSLNKTTKNIIADYLKSPRTIASFLSEIENNLSINSAKFGKINDACAQYIKDTKGEKVAYVSTLRTNQNVIYNFGIYVVQIQTMAKRLPETVIVLEHEDGSFEVAFTLRDF